MVTLWVPKNANVLSWSWNFWGNTWYTCIIRVSLVFLDGFVYSSCWNQWSSWLPQFQISKHLPCGHGSSPSSPSSLPQSRAMNGCKMIRWCSLRPRHFGDDLGCCASCLCGWKVWTPGEPICNGSSFGRICSSKSMSVSDVQKSSMFMHL